MPRHVLDVRKVMSATEDVPNSKEQEDEAGSNIARTEASPEATR